MASSPKLVPKPEDDLSSSRDDLSSSSTTPRNHTPERSSSPTTPHSSIHIQCHCGINSFFLPLPSTPLRTTMCHCGMCRHTLGACFPMAAILPRPFFSFSSPPPTLRGYSVLAGATRFFCSTCGSHILWHNHRPGQEESQSVLIGCITTSNPPPSSYLKFDYHEHVASAAEDGAPFFALLPGDRIPCFAGPGEQELHIEDKSIPKPMPASQIPLLATAALTGLPSTPEAIKYRGRAYGKYLGITCQCRNVQAMVFRPSTLPEEHRYYRHPKYVGKEGERWVATLCGCDSCRRSFGSPVVGYLYAAVDAVKWYTGRRPGPGTDYRAKAGLTVYQSSVDVERSFCSACGASVLYEWADRPGMYDVALGLCMFSARPAGERMRDWVVWEGGGVDWLEDLREWDKELAGLLEEGERGWMGMVNQVREEADGSVGGEKVENGVEKPGDKQIKADQGKDLEANKEAGKTQMVKLEGQLADLKVVDVGKSSEG